MTAHSISAGGRQNWAEATAAHPCPACGKAGWCRIRADGGLVACRRQEQGAYKTKADKNGAPIYLHKVGGPPIPDAPMRPAGPATPKADADALNAVYSALLELLTLSKTHRDDLLKRGLPGEAIDRNAYRSLPVRGRAEIARKLRDRFGQALLRVPGFIVKEGDGGPYLTLAGAAGLLIPVRDAAGRVVGIKVRRDGAGERTANIPGSHPPSTAAPALRPCLTSPSESHRRTDWCASPRDR